MRKTLTIVFSSFLAISLIMPTVGFAQKSSSDNAPQRDEATVATQNILDKEKVSEADLGLKKPILLPTSSFYFLKEASRAVQGFFTFGSVKKAELQLRFADEKLVETKAVAEKGSQKEGALKNALVNYQIQVETLKTRLSSLKETSQNPNVDKLLDKVTDRAIKHQKLFDELMAEPATTNVQEEILEADNKIVETIAIVSQKGSSKDFSGRLTRVFDEQLDEQRGGEFKAMRTLEIIQKLDPVLSQETKYGIASYRDELIGKAKTEIENLMPSSVSNSGTQTSGQVEPDEIQAIKAIDMLLALPGDPSIRLKILSEVKVKTESLNQPEVKESVSGLGLVERGFMKKFSPMRPGPVPIEPSNRPLIQVIWPTGGEKWHVGNTYTIAWRSPSSVKAVNIYLDTGIVCVQEPCPSRITIAENVPAGDNIFYYWDIPSGFGAYPRAQIIISDSSNYDINGRSGYFSIIRPAEKIQVIWPAGGEQWQVGQTYTISWLASSSIQRVNIYLDGGISRITIAENIPAGDNIFYYWTIPSKMSAYTKAQIIIADSSNPNVNGRSGYFSIISP